MPWLPDLPGRKNCPIHAAKMVDGKIVIDENVCNHCGRCISKCPFGVTEEFVSGYRVYIGGRWGKKVARGRYLEKVFTDKEEVLDIVEKQFFCSGNRGSRESDLRIRLKDSDLKMFRNSFWEMDC